MGRTKPLVVLIEDDVQIRRFLKPALEGAGFRIVEATAGRKGIQAAEMEKPDLILLDLGLPDIDGLEVIASLRRWSNVPIVILSAREHESDKVQALDAGADDYLTKPFGVEELLARVRVALRHRGAAASAEGEPVLRLGGLEVDLARRNVSVEGREIHLTPIQFKLLALLARNAGRVMTHRQLLQDVWGPGAQDSLYLRVYMNQLRQKLEAEPSRPKFLLTEPGVGYRLRLD